MSQDDHREWTRCLALATGQPLWEVSRPHEFERPLSGPGPRATPALSGQDLVTLGADGVLECQGQADGSLRWKRAMLDDAAAENTMHGAVASPPIVDQSVIVTAGGSLGAVTAYSLATGETQWRALSPRLGPPHLEHALPGGTLAVAPQ
ncbi:MAG: PQQ-binding-like beta-propeller repeat protein [Planctomycetales bacterium]|nr:PQQ-binding-like beta-propeller repeat protein [Planctomycetales bacterium]